MRGAIKMYNPNNAKKIERVPAGHVADGIIVSIEDGTPQGFIKTEDAKAKFKNINEPAINVTIETKYDGRIIRIEQMFTYIKGEKDTVLYTDDSNLGKYAKQYGHLPQVTDQVRLIANAKGFFKIIM